MKEKNMDRRSFFKYALVAAFLGPLFWRSDRAQAQSCPASPPAGKPIAMPGVGMSKSLEYVTVAEASKSPKYVKGQDCGNCKYYIHAKEEGGYAPCTMLAMKYVTTCGWCKTYLKKT